MPSKKKKYNARFPAGRIKKIMQTDEEIGKVAQAVPVIISRTLELFVESLLTKTLRITNTRNAKTLSPSHLKQCIMAENRFDFLRELVKNVPISDNQFESDPYGANHSNDNSSTNVSTASLSGGGTNGQHSDEAKPNSVTPPVQNNQTPSPFNFYGSLDTKPAATPAAMPLSSNLNFYTEITSDDNTNCDSNRPAQHHLLKRANTTTAPPPFKPKLPKLTRLNSAPSTVTSTTIQQKPTAAAASTPQFTISIPTPLSSAQLSQPVIKLDYSHLAQQFSAAAASTSFNNQQPVPTISIDFSNYTNATTTATSAAAASTNGLDEDYDDI